MKKIILHSIIVCGLMAGNCFAAEAATQAEQVQPKGRLRSEKEIWQKGIAAAKKRHWNKQRLTRQERDYYNALRKRVGGTVAAVLALIGLGYGAKKYAERGAQPPARVPLSQEEQNLIDAAKRGDLDEVNELLAVPGINVNAQDVMGDTALMRAAIGGHDRIVERLLDVPGIDVNIQDVALFGDTALMKATKKGHGNIVRMLLAVPNIELNAQDKAGWTALMKAASLKRSAILRMLIEAGADVTIKNNSGETVEDQAREWVYIDPQTGYGFTSRYEDDPGLPLDRILNIVRRLRLEKESGAS